MCSNIWYDVKDVKNMKKMRKIMLQRAEKSIKISQNKKRGRYILDEFNLLPPSNIRPIYVYDECHNLDHIEHVIVNI